MPRAQLFAVFFFTIFLLLLHELWRFVAPFLSPLLWAAILALSVWPLTRRLVTLFRGARGAAAGVMVVVVLVGAILPGIYLGSVLVQQSSQVFGRVQDMARTGELTVLFERVRATRVGAAWTWAASYLAEQPPIDPGDLVVRAAQFVSDQIVGRATSLARNVLITLFHFSLMVVALFFFFRDGERMADGVRDLVPMEAAHTDAVFARLSDTLSAVVQGMLATAIVQGVLGGVGYWLIARSSFAFFLGFLTGLAAFVPVAGPALVWGGMAIVLWLTGEPGRAIGMALWGALVVSTADNVVKPIVIGGRANLPTFLLLLSLLGGLQVYGFLGVFLGPVILAILITFVDIYREDYHPAAATPDGG